MACGNTELIESHILRCTAQFVHCWHGQCSNNSAVLSYSM